MGAVKAAGNSAAVMTYNFTDDAPLSIGYYRLRSVDLDGKNEVSSVVSVRRGGAAKLTLQKVAPVPTTDDVNISFDNDASSDKIQLTLTDLSGKTVLSQNNAITEGSNQIRLVMRDLPSGLYFLNLNNGFENVKVKVVKN